MDSFFSIEGSVYGGTCLHSSLEFARRDKWGSEVLWVTVMAGRYEVLGLKYL